MVVVKYSPVVELVSLAELVLVVEPVHVIKSAQ